MNDTAKVRSLSSKLRTGRRNGAFSNLCFRSSDGDSNSVLLTQLFEQRLRWQSRNSQRLADGRNGYTSTFILHPGCHLLQLIFCIQICHIISYCVLRENSSSHLYEHHGDTKRL